VKKTKPAGGQKTKARKQPQPRDTRDTRDTRQAAKAAKAAKKLPDSLLKLFVLKPFVFTDWGFEMPPALGAAEGAGERGEQETSGEWARIASENIANLLRSAASGGERIADVALVLDQLKRVPPIVEDLPPCIADLALVLDQLVGGLYALAARGREWAALVLADGLQSAVGRFEMLTAANPKLAPIISAWAMDKPAIPGMISRNPEKERLNQKHLVEIKQGKNFKFATVPTGKRGKRFQFLYGANRHAVLLVDYIENARQRYAAHMLQAPHSGQEIPGWLRAAMKLEPFSAKPKTWWAWANVAWQVIAEISPNGKPGQHPAYYAPETKICNVRKSRTEDDSSKSAKWDARKLRQSPSIAEQDIREAFFGGFEMIATGTSPTTKRRKKAPPDK